MSADKQPSPSGPRVAADRSAGSNHSRQGAFSTAYHTRTGRNDRSVVVGIIGKSRFGKAAIANALLDRPVFRSIPLDHGLLESNLTSGSQNDSTAIDLYHDTESNIIYLSIVSDRDYTQLFNSVLSTDVESLNSPEAAHDWIYRKEHADLRAALFLFCVSHIILVAQPGPRVELEWIRCLRVLQAVKEQSGPTLHGILTSAAASKMLDVNMHHLHSQFAPVKVVPTMAFVFDDSTLASVKARKSAGTGPSVPDFASLFSPPPKEDKDAKSPYNLLNAKLQQALESQVRMLLKKSKTANSSSAGSASGQQQRPGHHYHHHQQPFSKLFQLDINQAAHVITLGEVEHTSFVSHHSPLMLFDYSARPYGSQQQNAPSAMPGFAPLDLVTRILQDDSGKLRLRRWLQTKIDNILTQSIQASTNQQSQQQQGTGQPGKQRHSNMELLSSAAWFSAANLLRERLIYGRDSSADLERQLSHLRSALDPEMHLSTEICNHAASAARLCYFADLPQHYTTAVHQARLDLAKRVYAKLARGPAAAHAIQQLVAESEKHWRDGHQRCDAVSATNRSCVHPIHNVPESTPIQGRAGSQASDSTLKSMEHSSGYRAMHACNCGRTRRIREDPFDLMSANSTFFISECCSSLPSLLPQPGSQPDTIDEAPSASLGSAAAQTARFHNWSVLVLSNSVRQPSAPFVPLYNQDKGFQQDGFLPSLNALLPWDVSISKVKAAAKAASMPPAAASPTQPSSGSSPQTSLKSSGLKAPASPVKGTLSVVPPPTKSTSSRQQQQGKRGRRSDMDAGSQSQDLVEYLDKALKEKDTRRAFIGIEYECPLGHRFFASPDIVASVMGLKAYVKSGKVDIDRLLSEQELPMFIPCSCGKNNALAQLQRIYLVTPENSSSIRFLINPTVQWAIPSEVLGAQGAKLTTSSDNATAAAPSAPAMSFHLGREVIYPASEYSIIVVRFPYVYATARKSLIQTAPNVPYKCTLLPHSIRPI